MMESGSTSEMSVNVYQTTQHNIPEDSHLHTRRRENVKSHQVSWFVVFSLERITVHVAVIIIQPDDE
jgi:hypothetical protein